MRPFPPGGGRTSRLGRCRPSAADPATLVPGVARGTAAQTVTFTARNVAEGFDVVQLLDRTG
ncbi:hypothetical protein TPA0908_13330 [Micromonospora sp. AKA38]|nr:hypothetical protein TPA0908_13330 [Micromonospora sp. AKA38]